MTRSILARALPPVAGLLATSIALGGAPSDSFAFEDAARRSDRIVIATVVGVGAGTVTLPSGVEIVLGIKDAATGLVFTPYRVRISSCLLADDASCQTGDGDVFVPGGTVYETVHGQQRLRTWEVPGAAGAPLPPAGEDVLLFMGKRNGRYLPLNDRAARVRVDRSSGPASVLLTFESPRLLSEQGRDSVRARAGAGNPATTRPEFIEAVPLDRLKELIARAREVPKPTSGNRHALPDLADRDAAAALRGPGSRLRAGEDAR